MDTTATTPALPDPTDLHAVRAWLAHHTPVLPAVRAWIARTTNPCGVTAGGYAAPAGSAGTCSVPVFGTTAWVALPDEDPRKLAAALHTAYAHLADQTTAAVSRRVRAELDETARALRQAVTDMSNAMSGGTPGGGGRFVGPSHAELERRRYSYPCRGCGRALPFQATDCAVCGWTEPTPDQLRTTADWTDRDASGSDRTESRDGKDAA